MLRRKWPFHALHATLFKAASTSEPTREMIGQKRMTCCAFPLVSSSFTLLITTSSAPKVSPVVIFWTLTRWEETNIQNEKNQSCTNPFMLKDNWHIHLLKGFLMFCLPNMKRRDVRYKKYPFVHPLLLIPQRKTCIIFRFKYLDLMIF